LYEYSVPAVSPVCSYTVLSPSYTGTVGAAPPTSYTRYLVASSPLDESEAGAFHERLIEVDV
jgi:hypothetical protein